MQIDFPSNSVMVSGFAQLPKGTTLYEKYKVVGVVFVVDLNTSQIVDATFTFVADLTNKFLVSLVKGYYLNQGIDPLLAEVRKRCQLPSLGAVIQAIRSCYDRYVESFGN
ncbi:DUF3870 domain-containing protein [Desulfotomaculum copahuensis]|uniref:DUF3870 domain-containing protein n=1 Tax=Desulfotomaculum copahuensis TaxID=1838280 RepID=A0A1B7LAH1_9FIRM|nr:DUF3870 domain-containing protein [Desulfotomaculum copahuensis]OAT79328.1 hypothetical protein A6M21_16180 [Desulfotomaculum copahuensis]